MDYYRVVKSQLARRLFRKVFGECSSPYYLIYGNLIFNQAIPTIIEQSSQIPAEAKGLLQRFPLAKRGKPNRCFSAENTVSASEIRAAAYLSTSVVETIGATTHVTSDDSVAEKLDLDFVSFGIMNNTKTLDLLANPGNEFANYDERLGRFVSKSTGKPFHEGATTTEDYGVILKIRPLQFPNRSWIVCGGIGEWGTSGAAWFLAHRWKQIAARLTQNNDPFLALIRVVPSQDESASIEFVAEYPAVLPEVRVHRIGSVSNSTATTLQQ